MTLEAVGVLLATRRCPGVELSSQPPPGGKKPLSALLARKEPTLSSYQLAQHLGALCQKMYFKKARDIAKSTMQLCWPRNSGLHYDLCSRVAAAAAAALGTRMVQSKEEQCGAE